MASIRLFNPELVIARLADQVVDLKEIAGAANHAAALEDLKQAPAAYVIETINQSNANQVVGAISQNVTMRFGLVLAIKHVADARGENAKAILTPLREACMTALLGWEPEAGFDPCGYSSDRLLQYSDMVLWWQDDYFTAALQRSV